ncbi:MAG: hypothetical protein ACLR9T_00980 [Thomasclavelia sp.]
MFEHTDYSYIFNHVSDDIKNIVISR